jgi:hypothetical protein
VVTKVLKKYAVVMLFPFLTSFPRLPHFEGHIHGLVDTMASTYTNAGARLIFNFHYFQTSTYLLVIFFFMLPIMIPVIKFVPLTPIARLLRKIKASDMAPLRPHAKRQSLLTALKR